MGEGKGRWLKAFRSAPLPTPTSPNNRSARRGRAVAHHCKKINETTHFERFLQKQVSDLIFATCTTQNLPGFKTWSGKQSGNEQG